MKPVVEAHLEDLVLARLSVLSKRPPRPSGLQKALYPFVALRLTEAEWRNRLSGVLDSLREHGFVERKALLLTGKGRDRIQQTLGLNAAPVAKSWRAFQFKYLPRLVSPSAGRAAAPDPALALIAERLRTSASPKTTASLVNTWIARAFGMRSNRLTLDSLRAALLARELGVPVRPQLEQVVRLGAAKLAGSPSGERGEIVRALTARWLAGEGSGILGQTETRDLSEAQTVAVREQTLLKKIRLAAVGSGARRFGPDKVFIASVWETLKNDPDVSPLGEQGFKHALVEAHRTGALVLSRADLIAAMDPRDVAASETQHLNATYHFIQV
jgi:hypothetical protein